MEHDRLGPIKIILKFKHDNGNILILCESNLTIEYDRWDLSKSYEKRKNSPVYYFLWSSDENEPVHTMGFTLLRYPKSGNRVTFIGARKMFNQTIKSPLKHVRFTKSI